MSKVDAAIIARDLMGFLRFRPNVMVLPRVFVNCSYWESDVIAVRSTGFWTEYEIKVSVADFNRDFQKSTLKRGRGSRKHEIYTTQLCGRLKAAPKHFYFVAPKDMLRLELIPEHCGLIDWSPDERGRIWGCKVVKKAPQLPAAAKLSPKAIFALGVKAGQRIAVGRWSGFADRGVAMNFDMDAVPSTVEAAVTALVASLDEEDLVFVTASESRARLHDTLGRALRNLWSLWEDTPLRRDAIEKYRISHADDISGLITDWAIASIRKQPFDPIAACDVYHQHWQAAGLTAIQAGQLTLDPSPEDEHDGD